MNKIYLAVALTCWGSAALAAQEVEINVTANGIRAMTGLSAASGTLQLEDGEFRQVRVVKLPNGQQRIRYEQVWNGIPVMGQVVVADKSLNGQLQQASGRMLRQIDQDVASPVATLSPQDAASKAKAGSKGSNEQVKLYVMQDENGLARLVYQVSFIAEGDKPSRPFVILDAQSGEELKRWEGINHKDATGPGATSRPANTSTAPTLARSSSMTTAG